ncbi:YbgC/FadM family acyl-CoA thioesterase [Inhella gelatinilytica]|uniref:YbgC/FadM family acyl-CoA thioesterase n=1 Tax=Inhella gelatinilytica TaxID=2795030 RepID=A0A931J099_9BURK|nr:YbgC/FadM family acyl-CoA thioesterase [Inhella gelatinilytica]MBH9553036.1 YbgC/FadM family acyl-CoA thioesterase [Inhella gelatinilytica]
MTNNPVALPPHPCRHWEDWRVRWSEVDAQGIVFNAHYLSALDTASTGYWRALGLPYPSAFELMGADLVLRASQLDYLSPARFDDLLRCGVRFVSAGRTSLSFAAEIRRAGQTLLKADLRYVMVEREALVPTPVPDALRKALEAFEAGESMVAVRVGTWEALGAEAQPIRQAVFVREQGIPAELEWDEADRHCTHAVAFNRLGQALATGRLIEHVPGTAKIGRMAVRAAARGTGIGAQVLDALMQAARQQGYRQVLLHAQASAIGFYRRAGFTARGAPFEEAGIEHQEMTKGL